MSKIVLRYDKGSVLIDGIPHIPYAQFDPRINKLRAMGFYYQNIISYLKESNIIFEDYVLDLIPTPIFKTDPNDMIKLREYQYMAIKRWLRAGKKGSIVLPTGSGKTIIAIKIIQIINSSSLIIVPTIDLMNQWFTNLKKHFDIPIGRLGGGEDDIKGITITTYDSAYLKSHYLGNKFSLLIFDELHHLAAPGFRSIGEQFVSPYRLGITATFVREDNLHTELPRLVGGIVYQSSINELTDEKYLAKFTIEKRFVKMHSDERKTYDENIKIYNNFLQKTGLRYNGQMTFNRLIMMSGKNQEARTALLARNKAMSIALNSKSKIEELELILKENNRLKILIFTQHNKLVYAISSRFLIPFITHKSSQIEREQVLQFFKEGKYNVIVTSKVLDEGVDVPEAELGVIVSGTGSRREFIQRLGRLLRPKSQTEKKAKLIEIVSADTNETNTSYRRKRALLSI